MKLLRVFISSTLLVCSLIITFHAPVSALDLGGLLGPGSGGINQLLGSMGDALNLPLSNNNNSNTPTALDQFKTGLLTSLETETFNAPDNCSDTIMETDWSQAGNVGKYAVSNSRVTIEDGREKVNICMDFHNGKILVQTTFEADGEWLSQKPSRGTLTTQMYFKSIIFIDKTNLSKQLTYQEWKNLDPSKRDINFGDPKVLPSIEFEYDTYAEADGAIFSRATASLDELKLLSGLPGILTVIPGTTTLETTINYMKEGTNRSGNLFASDVGRDKIETRFTLLRVNQSEVYDGRGVGLQPLEQGKLKGMIEIDEQETLFKRLLKFFLPFVGIIAIAFLIFAGFRFITGSGNADTATKSRTMITYIVAGIIVIISAYPIVNTFLTLGTETNDNIRVEFRMGSSILLGADLNREDCMYSGSVTGLVRICYQNELLLFRTPIVNTFYQIPEVLGKCQEISVFSICVNRAQVLDDIY